MNEVTGEVRRLPATIGPRRVIGGLGALFVVISVLRAVVELSRGAPVGNVLIVTFLIAFPGFVLVYGVSWLSRADIDEEFYPDIALWCLGGFGAMGAILLVYHLQPEGSISDAMTSLPILTANGSVAGFTVGVHDGKAKTRTHQLEHRNQELQRTRGELENTVDQLETANERLEHYRVYTDDVLNAIDDIFYVLERDGTLQRWNGSLREVTGYSDAEVASMNAVAFFPESEREAIADAIADGFETGNVQVEAEIRTKDGERVPYEFAASTLTDPDEGTVLAGIGRDVRKRKERERELQRRAQQQQAVADLGQLALDTDDLDELMHEATRRVATVLDNEYCKVLDLDEERQELLLRQGVGWRDGIVGEETVSAIESDSQAAHTLATDHPIVVEDLETESRFGGPALLTSHDVKSGISTVIGSVDAPWGILGTHDVRRRTFSKEDVNFVQSVANILAEAIERQQYQEELEELVADLEESNERLEQFAYAASHDLQEPLRMVSSYLQLVERRYDDELDEDGREFIEFAVDGADRMRNMIDGLLQYSRVDTQGDPFEPVDLNDVLDDVRDDLQMRIAERDADIQSESLPRVEGDPEQLRQLFQNLLDNAIEYSGDGSPRIRISADRNGQKWAISVHDDGIGIDPEDTDRIFEVFQSLHNSADHAGTGIGLAICERIVERHGGEIDVESTPGDGSTFTFTLPTKNGQ